MEKQRRERLRDRLLQRGTAEVSRTEALELLDYIDQLEHLYRHTPAGQEI